MLIARFPAFGTDAFFPSAARRARCAMAIFRRDAALMIRLPVVAITEEPFSPASKDRA
jgi:hypothetical protein